MLASTHLISEADADPEHDPAEEQHRQVDGAGVECRSGEEAQPPAHDARPPPVPPRHRRRPD